jgi:hypothetical protein
MSRLRPRDKKILQNKHAALIHMDVQGAWIGFHVISQKADLCFMVRKGIFTCSSGPCLLSLNNIILHMSAGQELFGDKLHAQVPQHND